MVERDAADKNLRVLGWICVGCGKWKERPKSELEVPVREGCKPCEVLLEEVRLNPEPLVYFE